MYAEMSCNYFKEQYMGQVIQSTELGLVGRISAKSLCNAIFAI